MATHFCDIVYGNGIFVAVGSAGTLLTSPDGAAWTSRTLERTRHFTGIAYRNGTFVAVGHRGTLLTSPDGIAWTSRNPGRPSRCTA